MSSISGWSLLLLNFRRNLAFGSELGLGSESNNALASPPLLLVVEIDRFSSICSRCCRKGLSLQSSITVRLLNSISKL